MKSKLKRRVIRLKVISVYLIINLLFNLCFPSISLALTSGAASPEFSSFEPVTTTDMVDPFTGNFTYNLPVVSIPGADGGGYAMSLSYHSGVNSEEEASWVGLGWTLNAGAINRNKVGFADDFNGVTVHRYNKTLPVWTTSVSVDGSLEISSNDPPKQKISEDFTLKSLKDSKVDFNLFGGGDAPDLKIRANTSLRYNNYQGYTKTQGYSAAFKGMASLNMNRSGGESTFGFSVNPLVILKNFLTKVEVDKLKDLEVAEGFLPTGGKGISKLEMTMVSIFYQKLRDYSKARKRNSSLGFAMKFINPSMVPSNNNSFPGHSVARTVGRSYNFSSSFQPQLGLPVGIEVGFSGNTNFQMTYEESLMEAYGYMYNLNWSDYYNDGTKTVKDPFNDYGVESGVHHKDNRDSKKVADYFMERESSFSKQDKYLSIPFHGADQFIMTGEGVMGGFKMQHGKIGHYFPTPVKNKQVISQGGVEFGIGNPLSIGMDVGVGFQSTEIGNWDEKYRTEINSDYSFNYIPFARFNGDMGGQLRYTGTDLSYAEFDGNKDLKVSDNLVVNEQPSFTVGRSTSVLYRYYDENGDIGTHVLTSAGASPSVDFMVDPIDKLNSTNDLRVLKPKDGIAEIATVNPNGQQYVYGLPLYARNQANLTYGLTGGTNSLQDDRDWHSTGIPATVESQIKVDPTDNLTVIGDVIDEAYATSYLLTQITSPNYIDINNNGPDEEDFGGWTKFAYRKKHGATASNTGASNTNWYHHRAPYTGLFYNKGQINNQYDQTGSVSSGFKEVAYLKAVETKTHIAFFVTNDMVSGDCDDILDVIAVDNEGNIDIDLKNQLSNYLIGSGKSRHDGLSATSSEGQTVDAASTGDFTPNNNKELAYLEKIVLFSKERLNKPLTTTHFAYDYQLCKGVENNRNEIDNNPDYSQRGKLTLIRVWTESEGVARSRVAPYQFEYEYFNDYPASFLTNYDSDVTSIPSNTTSGSDTRENPAYQVDLLDPWGNYESKDVAENQRNKMRSWKYQGEQSPDYDPAAWTLKRIILPSGGEIHVQFEEKDYAFVQNKKAMAMVSLDEDALNENGMKYDENKYFINLNDIGIDASEDQADFNAYFDQLLNYFFEGDDLGLIASTNLQTYGNAFVNLDDSGVLANSDHPQIYFKYLYRLLGDGIATLYRNDDSKYIDGYVQVWEIGKTSQGIYFKLGAKEKATIASVKKVKYNVPRRLCRETLLTNGGTSLNQGNPGTNDRIRDINNDILNNAYPFDVGADNADEEGELKDIKQDVFNPVRDIIHNTYDFKFELYTNLITLKTTNPSLRNDEVCAKLDEEVSYLKLPVFHAKRGGGARVKRLLTYNPGIESGEESVYGTEYMYKMPDGTTSGVATFEPSGNRVENPLVEIFPRMKQNLLNKLLSGRDKGFQEGPLGEHLYPSASVAHRRVIMKNIYSGKSAPGFVVNNYHTCVDAPSVLVDHTEIHEKPNQQTKHYRKSKINLPLGLFNYRKDNAWVTQGYVFKIDDRHGKLKSTATYGGDIGVDGYVNPLENSLLASTTNIYSAPDDFHNSISINTNGEFVLNPEYRPGQEEELAMYMGTVKDKTNDFSIEFDINITMIVPPLISMGLGVSYSYSENELSQHVTSKVLRRNSILKKTINYAEGIETITEYLAYDPNTGNPILTKTNDQYEAYGASNADADKLKNDLNSDDHAYYSFNIPASWIYRQMGQKSKDPNNLNLLTAQAGSIVTYLSNPLDKFVNNVWNPHADQIDNVISASATEFENGRFNDQVQGAGNVANINTTKVKEDFEATAANSNFDSSDDLDQLNKFFYPIRSFAFIDEISSANSGGANKTYNSGMVNNFHFFNWFPTIFTGINNEANNWKYASQVTKFSPHGQPVEEVDILGIPSAVKFGYGNLLPTIVGSNSYYETMVFEDFEYSSTFEAESTHAHTGVKSLNFAAIGSEPLLKGISFTNQLNDKGGHFKIWLKNNGVEPQEELEPSIKINGTDYYLDKVARVGEWTLFQKYIKNWNNLIVSNSFDIYLNDNWPTNSDIYIDDVCFNPLESAVNCTVYDLASFRVLAQFGDQHFAKIFEYNSEGQLVRTVIETEKGRKTLQEQQYNIPRIKRRIEQ